MVRVMIGCETSAYDQWGALLPSEEEREHD